MQVNPPAGPGTRLSRTDRRRLRDERLKRLERRRADRDAFLRAQLEPDEVILARSGDHPFVTDRRVLSARRRYQPPGTDEWVCDSLAFSQITGWALGRQHDGRPIIRLEHAPVRQGPVPRDTTQLRFDRVSNPVFIALRKALEQSPAAQRESFVLQPDGSREERTRSTSVALGRISFRRRVRLRFRSLADRVYRGHVVWRVRFPSWLILAVPASLIAPWLVLPAIVVAEVAWIIFLQSRWRLERQRLRGL